MRSTTVDPAMARRTGLSRFRRAAAPSPIASIRKSRHDRPTRPRLRRPRARALRRAALRRPAPRQLPRRAEEVRRPAGPDASACSASSTCTPSPSGRTRRSWPPRPARSPPPTSPPGVDPDKAAIFPQSAVPAHAELAWIFNCVARLGWLDRMTQFKEKSGKHKERRQRRPLHLPGAAGRRHPGLQGHPRAGRRGPEAAPGADPRHRPEVQPRLRGARLLPAAPSR